MTGPRTAEYATRKMLVSEELAESWTWRTADGRVLSFVWGEPDADGFYEPTFTATDDGWLDAQRAEAAATERARLLDAVEALPLAMSDSLANPKWVIDRAAVLALLAAKRGADGEAG